VRSLLCVHLRNYHAVETNPRSTVATAVILLECLFAVYWQGLLNRYWAMLVALDFSLVCFTHVNALDHMALSFRICFSLTKRISIIENAI